VAPAAFKVERGGDGPYAGPGAGSGIPFGFADGQASTKRNEAIARLRRLWNSAIYRVTGISALIGRKASAGDTW